jgi:hypothetical protein
MEKLRKQMPTWRVRNIRSNYEWEGVLVAYWEASLDPISDNYTPKEIAARDLLEKWGEKVSKKYLNGLVPLHWFVECREHGAFEYMPFQFDHLSDQPREDFLTFFTWPKNSITGEWLNWLTLPVVDKLWNSKRADKGGFIQEATGWKPAILQPYIYLPALTTILRPY